MADLELAVNRQEMQNEQDTSAMLGFLLQERGLISSVQLKYALQKQRVEGKRLGNMLVHHGLASEHQIGKVIAEQLGITFLEADRFPIPQPEVLALFNRELCLSQGFLPLRRNGEHLEVLLGDGDMRQNAEIATRRTALRPLFFQGEFTKVTQATRTHYYFAKNPVEELIAFEVKRLGDDKDRVYSPERLLDYLLHLAVRERATDIHITPSELSMHVFLRVDGVLRPIFALRSIIARLLSYIKLAAEMNVSEQRLPQDGSFHTTVLDLPYTVRISTLITIHGERMVLRLLPEKNDLMDLEGLGYLREDVRLLQQAFARPTGIVLVTGPTGSGKSTTLHAALKMQSLIERNVLSIEDPVEYRAPGAGQTEVNRRAGYEFGSAMRHFLRHDPDVLLIGEIRDAETVQMAIDAASTGHLLLSTLHVGSVFGAVPRLRLLGADAESVAQNMIAVVNQRLVRRVCPQCGVEVELSGAERRYIGPGAPDTGMRGTGCERCADTGYYGRLPVYEILSVNQQIADAIGNGEPIQAIRRAAEEAGFVSIHDMACKRVIAGETTVEEIRRVVGGV